MAIVESTTIDGPSCPRVCDNSSLPDASTMGDGGLKPLMQAPSVRSEGAALACPSLTSPTFAPRKMTVSYIGLNMPYLRLQGLWLGRAGFRVGTHVRIEVSDRRLLVEAVEPEDLRCAEPDCPHEAMRKRRERRAKLHHTPRDRAPTDA